MHQVSLSEVSTTSPSRPWSPLQRAIFDDVARGTGHTVVLARAGCGKTTTIVEALAHVPRGCRTLLCAFNKEIERELSSRAPSGVTVSTLHRLGLRTLTAAIGRKAIDAEKGFKLVSELVEGDRPYDRQLRRILLKLSGLAKGSLARTREGVGDLIDAHQVDLAVPHDDEDDLYGSDDEDVTEYDRDEVCRLTLQLMKRAFERTETVDFDDMIWLPVVKNLRPAQFDRVFVDEAQDLNAAQVELALSACRYPSGRVCAVGDDKQAIYGFRGADKDALPKLTERLSAKVLPLSVTYRCAKAIVAHVQPLVPDFEAGPQNPEGQVLTVLAPYLREHVVPGDFVLSRTNAPLVALCLELLRARRRAIIQGSDLGTKLLGMVERSGAQTLEELVAYVCKWRDAQCKKLDARGQPTQPVEDTATCLLTLSEDAADVPALTARLQSLFVDVKDDLSRIVLSSTHKAKGLERERVWMLAETYEKRAGAKREPTAAEEQEGRNLYYVAATRAKSTLYLVRGVVTS